MVRATFVRRRVGSPAVNASAAPPSRGRPGATTHAEIEQAAFELFAEAGFAGTTARDIADRVGISRRTLFRYYPSKNDIPWGQFDRTLGGFRTLLDEQPEDLPVREAVHRGMVEFNRFPDDASPSHRDRMLLILRTPELQAHSVLRYAEWRGVIASYVARRVGQQPGDLFPSTVGQVCLALSLSAYEAWLEDADVPLTDRIDHAMAALRTYLGC